MCNADPAALIAAPIMIVLFLSFGLLFTAGFLFKIFLWWRIFSKTGYSGAFALLIFAPFGTLIMLCILAFSQWPVMKMPQASPAGSV
ncbi:MAG: hypothetical protein PHP01_04650 [Phycisphaerae bacterium]|nr:hypothetical protein [Phycisphaerae bacterium]